MYENVHSMYNFSKKMMFIWLRKKRVYAQMIIVIIYFGPGKQTLLVPKLSSSNDLQDENCFDRSLTRCFLLLLLLQFVTKVFDSKWLHENIDLTEKMVVVIFKMVIMW